MRYQTFSTHLTKLAQPDKKSKMRRAAESILAGGAGYGLGYAAGKYALPAITKRPPNISPRMAKVLGLISGASLAGMYALQGRYINDEKGINRSKAGKDSSVQSNNRKLFIRRKGHPSEVSSGVLLPNAERGESFSFRHGNRLADRRANVGADSFRRGDGEYRYTRKKTRDLSFEEPVFVRKPRSR